MPEKRLFKCVFHELRDEFYDRSEEHEAFPDDAEHYHDVANFVWCSRADGPIDNDDWDTAECWLEATDMGPMGNHGRCQISIAHFSEMTFNDVEVLRELLAAYDDWAANEAAHKSLFDEEV